MNINPEQKLTDIKGEELKDKDKSVYAKDIMVNALLVNDEKAEGTDKMERFLLAKKVSQATNEISLKAEEIVLIKEMVGKVYSPLIVGQIYELLEK
jgi:hypothetical protein